MLITENALRTIINTLLKEGQSFESFLADAEAEVEKTGNESKLIMLDEAAEYLGVEGYDELKDFISQQIDVRPMRKFDDFIIKVLYGLYAIDAGIDNWENLITILDNLYKKNNATLTKNYNDLLLQLKLVDPNDTRDIPSKIIKSNLPGAGKDSNDIPKSSIIMFSEMYPDEYNNGVTLLDKLVQGVTSIVDFKTYGGYSTDIINKNIANGNWKPVIKENNITVFKIDGYDGIVAANNIYDFKTAYNRKITKKDGEDSDLQYLDYFTDTHFLTDFNIDKKVRKPANWCVKDEDSYNDYVSKSNTPDGEFDAYVENEFYLVLNDNIPVDNPDGACLTIVYNGDRIKDQQIDQSATGYVSFDEYIKEHLYEEKSIKDIIDEYIIPYNYDVFYYGNWSAIGSKKSFQYYDHEQGGFCLIELSPEYDVVDMVLDISPSELSDSYLHVDNVTLKFVQDESHRLYKDMFVVNKSMFKGMSEFKYLSSVKKIITSRSVNSSSGAYSMLTWDTKLREAIKNYLGTDKQGGNIQVVREFEKYIDQILNFDDKDIEESELYNYIELFEKLGIGCINDVKGKVNNAAPPLDEVIEETGLYKILGNPNPIN